MKESREWTEPGMAATLARSPGRHCRGVVMGAANAVCAYRLYAGKVPFRSFQLLCYMALIALDRDPAPQYWQGWHDLAVNALGREGEVDEQGRLRATGPALKAVESAMGPLFAAGAVTTTRHSSGRRGGEITARYQLWLTTPAPPGKRGARDPRGDAWRPPENGGLGPSSPPGNEGVDNSSGNGCHPPENEGRESYTHPGKRAGAPRKTGP